MTSVKVKLLYSVLFLGFVLNYSECQRRQRTRTTTTQAPVDDEDDLFEPPTPLVEAFIPRGLRVSIPDESGIELFAFHGKINSQIRQNEAGTLSQDVIYPSNGRWTFQSKKPILRVGDVLNYWIFLQVNGTGYRVDSLSTVITELKEERLTPVVRDRPCHQSTRPSSSECAYNTAPTQRPERLPVSVTTTTYQPSTSNTPILVTTTTFNPEKYYEREVASQSCACPPPTVQVVPNPDCSCENGDLREIRRQLTATLSQLQDLNDKFGPLQGKVDSLNELLLELTKDMDIGTSLLITGVQPPGKNILEAVRSLIVDKLELQDLDGKINQARQTEYGVVFEVTSPVDKKRILHRASTRLANSPQQIIDYRANDQQLLDLDVRSGDE